MFWRGVNTSYKARAVGKSGHGGKIGQLTFWNTEKEISVEKHEAGGTPKCPLCGF
jgi:hypothetical protein